MSEHQFASALENLIAEISSVDPDDVLAFQGSDSLDTFEKAETSSFDAFGLLTRDAGIVVHLNNGQTFQVTVKERTG